MDYALVSYPLSDRFRDRLEGATGTQPQYLSLLELRRLSIPAMIRRLLRLNADRLLIPLEDDGSRALLPVFYCLASCAQARSIQVVHPDFRLESIPRLRTVTSLFAVMGASVAGQMTLARCKRELATLSKLPLIDAHVRDARSALYLKSNLWLGLKAGGSIGHVAGVANALDDAGCAVTFAGAEQPPLVKSSIPFHRIDPPAHFGLPYEINLYRYHDLFSKYIQPFVGANDFSFLYQRLSVSNYSGVLASRAHRLPLVLEYNGSEVWASRTWGKKARYDAIAQQAEDVCLRHSHLVVTVSEVLRDELVERKVPPERVVFYPNCIDPQMYDPGRYPSRDCQRLRARLDISPQAIVAGFVGTFGQWHGVDILAETIRQLAIHHTEWLKQQNVHFLIVGDGLLMGKVRETLADPRCKPFFTLTGLVPQNETALYLATCDLLLSPHVPNTDGTRFFGSPTKLFEYMAMGKPIVASDLEQIGHVLRNSLPADSLPTALPAGDRSELAVLAPPGSVPHLLRSIQFLVEQPRWRDCLGGNARREVLAKYTWKQHVAAIVDRLTQL